MKYRITNSLIAAAGFLLCIISGFIPAPQGLLTDGRISIIQALSSGQRTILFVLPTLLLLAAIILTALGKLRLISLITALAGASLFAVMDISFITGAKAFTGILLNEAGVVLTVCGVLLQVFGMPRDKAEQREADNDVNAAAQEESVPDPAPDIRDITAVYGKQDGFYEEGKRTASAGLAGRDTMELGDALIAALKAITEENEDRSKGANQQFEELAPEEEKSEESGSNQWANDSELENLLRNDLRHTEALETETATVIMPEETADTAEFYAGLEDMFRIQK